MIRVVKRNGRIEKLDVSKIQKYTADSVKDLNNVSQSELEVDAKLQFRDMISTEEIQQTLIKTAVDKIDIDRPDWTFVASRLFLYDLYHKANGFSGYSHLRDYLTRGEKEGRVVLGLKDKYDLDDLHDYIKPDRDLQFTYLGIRTLYDRYLIKDKIGKPIELPQQLFMGVSMFLAQNELDCQNWAKKFYDILSKFEVMAATPTLSNARTPRHQLSSCYIGSTSDNIEGIFDAYKEMALLSKFGGGIGWDWSRVRGMGSYIDGHKHAAGGIIPFLKIANDIAIAVDQLGCVAKNSFVRVLSKVKTDNFEHDFRREYQKTDFTNKEVLEGLASYSSSFAFEYGKFSKNFVSSLLFDYIMNKRGHYFLENIYGLTHDQYKKIIGRYKNIKKGLPEGFETIINYSSYAISQDGIIINRTNFRPLSNIIDRKGYIRVTLGKHPIPLHKILAKQYLGHIGGDTIDHIDANKLNNRIENLQIISNKNNISKGWNTTYKQRTEKARIRKYLSYGYKIKGNRRDTHNFEIENILTDVIAIDDIRIGDLVLSYNIDDNRIEYKPIISKHKIDVKIKDQIKILLENNNYIITSSWHPFPKLINKKIIYVRSDSINVDDITINDKGEFVKIKNIEKPKEKEDFFDLTVKDNNNYFCSTDNQEGSFHLIHNTRKGAIAVYIEPWHIDIKDFLDLKKNSGEERRRGHDLFPALWLNDLFMERVESDGLWTLFDPYEVSELTDIYGNEFNKRYIELEKMEGISKEVISAKSLWKDILRSYFETGNPFLTFKDTANRSNPNKNSGIIRSSNLCTEIMQNTSSNYYKIKITYNDKTTDIFEENEIIVVDNGMSKPARKITALDSLNGKQIWMVDKEEEDGETAVCNLASINLSKINSSEDIARVVPTAIRMLDNVIDLNFYPLAKVKVTNEKSRAIGLGVMGEAQMLAEQSIEWGSNEHFNKIDEVMEAVSYYAIRSSSDLALEKGKYPSYDGSDWSKGIFPIDKANKEACKLVDRGGLFGYSYNWQDLKLKVKEDGMRNGYLMAIAPTSSISILTGTTQAIEPVYKRKWFEENLSGLIPVVVPNLSPETWKYYTPSYEIDQRLLIRAGAIRQKWIDQGQSLNIFVTLDKASGKYLNDIYMDAWKFGLKSTYYLRSQSPEAVKETEGIEDRSLECVGCQ